MSALTDLLNRYNEGDKLTDLETLVVIAKDETAAEELAALRQARAERDALKEAIKKARIQLQATQINWQEDCLFECNDILTAALDVCPSCTWRGDVTLQDGKCPYCQTDWHKLREQA